MAYRRHTHSKTAARSANRRTPKKQPAHIFPVTTRFHHATLHPHPPRLAAAHCCRRIQIHAGRLHLGRHDDHAQNRRLHTRVLLLGSVEAAKVLFAIAIERYCPARGGRFRFWLLVSLAGIAASLVLLMLLDPRRHFVLLLPVLFVLSCFSVLFGSASVGLGSLLLPYRARGHGGVIQVMAARAGKMIGGAGVLWIFQQYGWTSAIAATLAFTFAVLLQTAAYREPEAFRQSAPARRLSDLFKRLALFWRNTPRGKTWFALLFASCIPYAATATTFTPEQRDYFTQAGFTIAKEGLVWRRGYPWPTPSQTILDVVAACITRLRDIAGINSPQQLCYSAWQYPTWKETPHGDEYIPGDMDLAIPELGIPHE